MQVDTGFRIMILALFFIFSATLFDSSSSLGQVMMVVYVERLHQP